MKNTVKKPIGENMVYPRIFVSPFGKKLVLEGLGQEHAFDITSSEKKGKLLVSIEINYQLVNSAFGFSSGTDSAFEVIRIATCNYFSEEQGWIFAGSRITKVKERLFTVVIAFTFKKTESKSKDSVSVKGLEQTKSSVLDVFLNLSLVALTFALLLWFLLWILL
ncbi:MAG: hypothetical protein V1716_05210 [Candidatus Uhrbacteria bacterium]